MKFVRNVRKIIVIFLWNIKQRSITRFKWRILHFDYFTDFVILRWFYKLAEIKICS